MLRNTQSRTYDIMLVHVSLYTVSTPFPSLETQHVLKLPTRLFERNPFRFFFLDLSNSSGVCKCAQHVSYSYHRPERTRTGTHCFAYKLHPTSCSLT
ncbi:hypothetical protein PM082_005832 [Marasmius tenuissimus]|nr:hypothetical protein PM082_005832 [Marasmius tenuissimus]